MAIVGIISTLLVHDMFIRNFDSRKKNKEEIEGQVGAGNYAGKT
jgi:hypothetical protein